MIRRVDTPEQKEAVKTINRLVKEFYDNHRYNQSPNIRPSAAQLEEMHNEANDLTMLLYNQYKHLWSRQSTITHLVTPDS